MKKGLLKVDFMSVKAYSEKLNTKAEELSVNLAAPTDLPIINVGLVPTYFGDFSTAVNKFNVYLKELSTNISQYHEALSTIEGYASEQATNEEKGQNGGRTDKKASVHGGEEGGHGIEPTQIVLPPEVAELTGYASLAPGSTMAQILAAIAAIIAPLGLTVDQLFSGDYNHLITQILMFASNTGTFIGTITQLKDLAMQAYLNGLRNSESQPTMFVPILGFLAYFAKFKDVTMDTLMIDPRFAIDIKTALQNHRLSLIELDNLNGREAIDVQNELKNLILGGDAKKINVDEITNQILKDYLSGVANKNNMSLEELLTNEQNAELAKTALNEFLKFWLYGDQSGLLFAGLSIVNGNITTATTVTEMVQNMIDEFDYSSLPIDAPIDDVNEALKKLLAQFGLTLEDLQSGNFNHLLTQILNNSSSAAVFIATIIQLNDLLLQSYLNELHNGETAPKQFVPISVLLNYLADSEGTDINTLLTDENYAASIKKALELHRESLLNLNGLTQQESSIIQQEINKLLLTNETTEYPVDDLTKKMLNDFFKSVADKNNISLNDMLTKEEYANLTKESLDEFLKFQLHGDDNNLPSANLVQDLENIANENNTTPEDILNGDNNDALSDFINDADNEESVSEVINNMDDEGLQDYVGEIVNENKHPEAAKNPVVKKVIEVIYKNKEYIKGDTEKFTPVLKEEIIEEPIITDIPKDEIKEILTDKKYAPIIKEVVKNNASFNWASLFPLAGLGLIPLIVVLRKKKNENKEDNIYSSNENKGMVDANFTYFADSNVVSEEFLLDGTNFELLSIYLSQLDSLSAVLAVLSSMKDENLQKYLYQLYNLKFEHVWSGNSLIIKIILNDLLTIASKQGIDISTLLSNSNYAVWVKTSIVDILKMYTKYEQDINSSGSFKLYLSSVLSKTILVEANNLNILNTYLELSAKNLGIDIEAFLNQISEFNNKLSVFAMVRYGDGIKPYIFGFINSLYQETKDNQDDTVLNENSFDDSVLSDLGYLSLLFNSTDDQIEKTLEKILNKYKISKTDLYNGDKQNFFDNLINKSTNLTLTLYLLIKMDSYKLQYYLYSMYKNSNDNKFILIILKFLEYLSKSENVSLEMLLTDIKYSNLIKESLKNFKKSSLNLYALTKKDDNKLNEEMNNLFFMEDTSSLGIDKITIYMLKDMLTNLAKTKEIGFNSLLDINNISILKELMEKIINIIMFINKDSVQSSSSDTLSKLPNALGKKEINSEENLATSNIAIQQYLLDGSDFKLLTSHIDKIEDMMSILSVLLNMKEDILQKYLKELYGNTNNKFIEIIFMFLTHYAKLENTTLVALLSESKYAASIKESLDIFKKSLLNIDLLSKIEANELTKELNNIFTVENNSSFGIDKATIEMLKELLSKSTQTDSVDINSLLDPKNANVLKKLMQRIINNILFIEKEIKNTQSIDFSKTDIKLSKENMLSMLQRVFSLESNGDRELKNKIINYINLMIKDSGMKFEEYIYAQEFSNFIKINFDNSNIMTLVYDYLKTDISYDFDINKLFDNIASKNSLNLNELKSKNGISFIIENIIKENNIIFTIESILNNEKEVSYEIVKQLYNIKENANVNKLFLYIDENLKRPKDRLLEEYLNEEQNLKNVIMFLLKILVMLLMLMLLSDDNKERVI